MLKGISTSDPYILIEVPDFDWIIKKQAFWDITYEHVNYFSKTTFLKLFYGRTKIINLFKGQYLLVLAKLSRLDQNFDKNLKSKNINLKKIFPKINDKISYLQETYKENLYFWEALQKH